MKIALAEAEARAGDPDRAVAILDEALATSDRTGFRAFEAELHRARGEILLKRDPANPAPAEEAFLAAIAVAKQQGTRSFELRAALSLAKLYQSTGRPADAHAVLAPALEGFSPTPEMPEIAEAQALLAALAETEEVKAADSAAAAAAASANGLRPGGDVVQGFRRRGNEGRLRARRGARGEDRRFCGAFRSRPRSVGRRSCEANCGLRGAGLGFLQEAEDAGRIVEAGVARRGLALSLLPGRRIRRGADHCERALDACDPERDRETRDSLQRRHRRHCDVRPRA